MNRTILLLLVVALAASSVMALQDRSHVVRFKRQQAIDASKYPATLVTPPRSSLPKAWTDALEALQNAGKIPDIPVSKASDQGVTYPNNAGMLNSTCSWTVTNCFGANDLHQGSNGVWTISFDDGPTQVSQGLYDFLNSQKVTGTHFMIGSQILAYPSAAKHALKTGQQLAVHTWAHTLQTTKDNYEVLGELGWTMQIIYDLTGRVPSLWRPPQGDIDNRVRAIAEGVFNLTAVMWDSECNDWCINANGQSSCPGETPGKDPASVKAAIQQALAKPKSPGVILLEHELNSYTVGFFESYFPTLAGRGWKPMNVPDQFGWNWYFNAKGNLDTPINVTSMVYSDIAKSVAAAGNSSGNNRAAFKSANSTSNSTNAGNAQSLAKSGARGTFELHFAAVAVTLAVLCLSIALA